MGVGVKTTLVGNTGGVSVGVEVGVGVIVGVSVGGAVGVSVGMGVSVAVGVTATVAVAVATGAGVQNVRLSMSSGPGKPLSGTRVPVLGSMARIPRLSL